MHRAGFEPTLETRLSGGRTTLHYTYDAKLGAAKGLEPLWQLVLDALSGARLLHALQNSRSLFYTDSDIFTDFTMNSLSLFNNLFRKFGAS